MTTNPKTFKHLKKYICEYCNFGCSQKSGINNHLMTKKHKTNEQLTTTNVKTTIKPLNKYICVCCDFECSQKCDINNHLMTKKHLTNEQLTANVDKESQKNYTCKCGKAYKHMSSLCKHKRTCVIEEEPEKNNKIINLLIENNKQLQYDNKEFKNIIIQQNAAILELTKNGINSNNTTNNTTNTTNKQTFNLNFFLNDTCKDAVNITDFFNSIQLTYLDFMNVGCEGYVKGISKIFNNNMKKIAEIERPIHCTDEKRGTIYIKDDGKWEKDDDDSKKLNSLISKIATKNFREVTSYKKKFPDCTKSLSKHSDIYNKCIVEAMGGPGDDEDQKKEKIKRSILKTVLIKTK
jgi:hypothetical protein